MRGNELSQAMKKSKALKDKAYYFYRHGKKGLDIDTSEADWNMIKTISNPSKAFENVDLSQYGAIFG